MDIDSLMAGFSRMPGDALSDYLSGHAMGSAFEPDRFRSTMGLSSNQLHEELNAGINRGVLRKTPGSGYEVTVRVGKS